LIIAIGSLICLAASLVIWRLQQVDQQFREGLVDAVHAQVAALRVGDRDAFMAMHRSRSSPFLVEQQREFEVYQQLKQAHRIQLTGNVLDVAIDDLTGRVVVEEIIDGVPYKVVWYYWYYEPDGSGEASGWRRVPDNLEFWGEDREIRTERTRVHYRALDEDLAQALSPRLEDWWTRGCALLGCEQDPPALHVEIVARPPTPVAWDRDDAWTLIVPSPLVTRARVDTPLTSDLEQTIRELVAARLTQYAAGEYALTATGDGVWIISELERWLSNHLTAGHTTPTADPTFVGQLVAQYGPDAIPALIRVVGAETPLDTIIQAVSGVSLAQMSVEQLNQLDWRGFFQWRVRLERELLVQPESGARFLSLYDMDRADAASTANVRLQDPYYAASDTPQVTAIGITRDENGETFAVIELVQSGAGEPSSETAFWRLTGGTWKRVS